LHLVEGKKSSEELILLLFLLGTNWGQTVVFCVEYSPNEYIYKHIKALRILDFRTVCHYSILKTHDLKSCGR
jgi:hypothetical protein